jgi:hypothetical protein
LGKKLVKKSNGDVRVIGMVAGNHVLEDIGRDVPFRTLVIIPEDQALMSKDLWRSISQGALCQIPSAPYPSSTAALPDPDKIRMEKYATELEGHVVRLQTENDALKRQLEGGADQHSAKLDEILKAIKSGVMVAPPQPAQQQAAASRPVPEETVDGSAPTFLPSEIKPRDIEARINIQGEESNSDAVSDAADRLRQLRKNDPKP